MRVSLNWLKRYINIPAEVSTDELVRLIGARLVEVEGVTDETHKYDNIYIVRVESCEKIPDTHLTLCQINVGDVEVSKVEKNAEGLVQVVCGAPNVREGMLAVWVAPGAIVPASVREDAPFVIGKRKMQGYESCGMLAGADELDFGDDHSGIVEIAPGIEPGTPLADVFMLNDLVLDIENKSLTHRPDCFGIIGFAREVAGILGVKFEEPRIYPEGFELTELDKSMEPVIKIEDSNICRRYSTVALRKNGEMKKKYLSLEDTLLAKSGMKPIDPIVDATNFLMLLTGQPLHAFDYDKFVKVGKSDKPVIKVRLAKKSEKLMLLDGKEIELCDDDIVICSGDIPVALAGAMGGESTMIDENTKNIIIESATFSLYNLRKTQMVHGIFTEAITRFTKGQSPNQTMEVATACAQYLIDGFKAVSVADAYPEPVKNEAIEISAEQINTLLGTEYSYELIEKTLRNVGFEISCDCGEKDACKCEYVNVTAPAWRMDIHIKEDVIEEVGRLLGYDNILLTLPLHASAGRNSSFEFKAELRELLARYGANEVLTYSFISEKLLQKCGLDPSNSYKIINSISPDLQYVRQSLIPSLLDKAYVNQKMPIDKFAIFEINDTYQKQNGVDEDGVPVEKTSLGFVVAERKNDTTAYYKAKKYINKILSVNGVEVKYLPLKNETPESMPFENKRAAEIVVDGELLGIVGEFKNSVRNEFKLAPYLAGFEIDVKLLADKINEKRKIDLDETLSEDVTITTNKTYDEALVEVEKKRQNIVKILPLSIYQAPGQQTRNISFRIFYKKQDC